MKRMRYPEEKIITVLKKHEAGGPQAGRRPSTRPPWAELTMRLRTGTDQPQDHALPGPVAARDAFLMSRLRTHGEQYPSHGFLLLHGMLRADALVTNRKWTYRLYTKLDMQMRTKRRNKLWRPRLPAAVPTRPHTMELSYSTWLPSEGKVT